jgi:ubiquinone/menaquinone biosynthesis C-methylase UbiE
VSSPVSVPEASDPRAILDMNYAYARTALIVAAVRLWIFTHLAQGHQTIPDLAAQIGTTPDSLTRFLAGLQSLGLIERAGATYQLAPLAQKSLVEGKPGYLGGDTLAMLDYLPAWFELDQTILTSVPYRDLGDATTAEAFFAPRVRDLFAQIHPAARATVTKLPLAEPSDEALQILDIGAGSAPWSAAFVLHYSGAHVTAVDLPTVAEQGRKQISEMGLSERYTWIAANMETIELTSNSYDLIIVAHVCRFLSDQRVQALLARLVESLHPNGTLIVADIFYNDDRTGPPSAITLDLSMLVNTAQGRIRTCAEVAAWLNDYGLHGAQSLHAAGPFPVVIARKEERI